MNIAEPTVFLVDDDPSVLKAISNVLIKKSLKVLAFSSATDFLDTYKDEPGCLVTDLSMPSMSGLDLQEQLKIRQITIPVIFITGHGGIRDSVQALKAGAVDFLEKPFLPETLFQTIADALEKDSAARLELNKNKDIRSKFSQLTDRECEIFRLLIENSDVPSSKQMAETLGISYRTVEHHRSNMLLKTGTKSVTELLTLAKDVGFELPEIT